MSPSKRRALRSAVVGLGLVCAVGLIVAGRAWATLVFHSSLDICALDTSTDLKFWDAITGFRPTVSTVVDPSEPGNRCSLRFQPGQPTPVTTASPSFVAKAVAPADDTIYAGVRVRVDTIPATRRKILSMYQTNHSASSAKTGCMLTIEPDATVPTKYRIKTFYESSDPLAQVGECSASSTMDGTECGGSCTVGTRTSCAIGKSGGVCQRGANDGTSCTADSTCTGGGLCSATVCRALCPGGTNAGGACTTGADCPGVNVCGRCVNECDEHNPGEATCGAAPTATSDALTKNTWYVATLYQQNVKLCLAGTNAGNVCTILGATSECPSSTCAFGGKAKCGLWTGTAGAQPASYARGAQTRKQGKCAGGTKQNFACAIDGDCPSSTCTITDIITVAQIRFGSDDAIQGDPADYYLDDPWIDDNDLLQNWRIESLVADGKGSLGNWTASGCTAGSEWLCVNDGTSPDGDTSYLADGAAANPLGILTLENPRATPTATTKPTATAATPSPQATSTARGILAVSVSALGKNHTTSGTASVRLEIADSTGTYAGATSYAFSGWSDFGGSALYHQFPPVTRTLRSDNSAWTWASLTSLGLTLDKTAGGNDIARVSSAVSADVMIALVDPPVPTTLRDVNGDGEITVAVAGDSTVKDAAFYDAFVGGLLQPANIYDCARGGLTPGDLEKYWDVAGANNDVLDGGAAGFLACYVKKGTGGRPPDYVIVEAVVNAVHGLFGNPDNGPFEGGVPTPQVTPGPGFGNGYCDDNGGSRQGRSCSCPQNDVWESDLSLATTQYYCRVKGTNFKLPCKGDVSSNGYGGECGCATGADCKVNTGDASGTCTGGLCQFNGYSSGSSCRVSIGAAPSAWCVAGCLNAPGCTSGLCVSTNSVPKVSGVYQRLATLAAARTTPPVVIYVAPPPGGPYAATAGDYPWGCWDQIGPQVSTYRAWLLNWARTNGKNYIDMWARFQNGCPAFTRSCTFTTNAPCSVPVSADGSTEDATMCIRDGIHWTTRGQQVAAQSMIDCLTNASGGTSDGVCGGSNLCTVGRINDRCAANADCNTYVCVP